MKLSFRFGISVFPCAGTWDKASVWIFCTYSHSASLAMEHTHQNAYLKMNVVMRNVCCITSLWDWFHPYDNIGMILQIFVLWDTHYSFQIIRFLSSYGSNDRWRFCQCVHVQTHNTYHIHYYLFTNSHQMRCDYRDSSAFFFSLLSSDQNANGVGMDQLLIYSL
jgi:hypothetical protein